MIFRIIAVIAAGASMRLISPPIGLYGLHWFNLVLAFWALYAGNNKRNAWLMYLFGVSLIATNYYWITESAQTFAQIPLVLCWLIILLYAGFFALPFALIGAATHWVRDRIGIHWIWLIPGLQVAIEQTWPALFPYYHGALFYRSEWTWQFASVFGVTSLSFLVFLINATFSEVIYRKRMAKPMPWNALAIVALCWGGISGFGYMRYNNIAEEIAKAPSLRVSVLQQDVTMKYRLDRDTWEAIKDWQVLTDKILDQKPDLVIWPEGAMGGPYNPIEERSCREYPHDSIKACRILNNKSLKEYFSSLAKDNEFDFLIGGGTFTPFVGDVIAKMRREGGEPEYSATNSLYLFDHTGEVTGRYDKMILLPFGEYIPLADTFPFLRKIIQGPGNFQAGAEVTYFDAGSKNIPYRFSTPICYEAILNSQMRKMTEADLFINVTNDAWFGDTAAPHQHAMLAAVQSIEWGRPMIRNAYTGVSFFVEANGNIIEETKPFVPEAHVAELKLYKTDTIYRQGGWIFPWLWVIGSPIAFLILRKREVPSLAKETPKDEEETSIPEASESE
jgi:apolipoprotein N-acyltransferase